MAVERVEVKDEDPEFTVDAELSPADLAELEAERVDHAQNNPEQASNVDAAVAEGNTVENAPKEELGQESEFSSEAVVGLFQKLLDEDPENAVKTMRDNIASAVEEERVTPKFQEILNKILDDVEGAEPEQQAQMFKEAVENSPELKDEVANALLLRDAAQDQVSSLLESGGGFALIFAVLSIVAGGNGDFMAAMNGVMEELGVDMKPIQDTLAPRQDAPEQPASVTTENAPDGQLETAAQNESQELSSDGQPVTAPAAVEGDMQIATVLTGFDFGTTSDSEFQGSPEIRADALAALSDVNVSTAGIEGLEQGMPTDQLEETAAYNPLALA